MAYKAEVVADSVSQFGVRLTTIEATLPRIVLAELNTHRMFSRNSASTRAIPAMTQLRNILENPFIPERFGINQPGMQSQEWLKGAKHEEAREIWLQNRDRAVTGVVELLLGVDLAQEVLGYEADREYVSADVLIDKLSEVDSLIPKSSDDPDRFIDPRLLNVHKQLAGRGLEAYMWHTVVITATEWSNFLALRDHPAAQGEIAKAARLIRQALERSTPRLIREGEWHTPYVDDSEDLSPRVRVMASTARCAAVSYNRQRAKVLEREIDRYNDLLTSGHMSPFEHPATPFTAAEFALRESAKVMSASIAARTPGVDEDLVARIVSTLECDGNFRGWTQHRKQIPHEADFDQLS